MLLNKGMTLNLNRVVKSMGPSTLLNGLTHRWGLDETSGTRVDSITAAQANLASNNTVGSTTGFSGSSGNAATFVNASAQDLSKTQALFAAGSSRSIAFWFYATDNSGAARTLFSVDASAASGDRLWAAHYGGTNPNKNLSLTTRGGAGGCSTAGFFSTGSWHFVLFTYDGTSHKIYADGNLTAKASVSEADSGGNAHFSIGRSAAGYMDGYIDEFVIYNRVITPAEHTLLAAGAIWPYTGLP